MKDKSKLLDIDSALRLTRSEMVEMHREYLNSSLVQLMSLIKFTRQFVRAFGMRVWDSEENEYLDFLGGYGSLNMGHNHPEIIKAVQTAKDLPNLLQASLGTLAAALAHNLALIAPGDLKRSFFCNSGAEAVECALKLARIATGKQKIISAENSFHGKTLGALSVSGREKYRKPFLPLLPECNHVPFGDTNALETLLNPKDVAAVLLEPIQGEGGIVVPPKEYLSRVSELCRQSSALLILDEIQTGFGRTGTWFACEAEDVKPDILCLGKSLGGGIAPLAACMSTDAVWQKAYGSMDRALLHTSTFGGNALACAAGIAALNVLAEENLVENAEIQGRYLMAGLSELKREFPIIRDVRGRGLLIGMEFEQPKGILHSLTGGLSHRIAEEYTGSLVAGSLMNQHRIITAYTLNNPNVIRFEPPLVVQKPEIDNLLEALRQVFEKEKGFAGLAFSAAKSLLQRS